MAWERLCLLVGRTQCGSWIGCSISQAMASSLWLPEEVPCGFHKDASGAGVCPQKRLSCTKRSALLCIHHKPDQTLALASFHIQEFYQTLFLSFPRLLLKYQTKCIKNCRTSCFFLSCGFQNTLLKGARRLLTPNSFKCKRRKQLTAAQIKIQALSCLQGLSCSCCGGHSDTPRS